MDILNAHDLAHFGVYIMGMAVTIAVLRTDMRWLKEWSRRHEEADVDRFYQLGEDVRELRHKIMEERK
jgi:hypothetical protein